MGNCRVLTVGVIDENPILLLTVTDSGKGISPEMLPRILERFFTTKKTNNAAGWGWILLKKLWKNIRLK
jgi:signal transduction histidine kinase